jgi:hypothetical protein
MTEIERHVPAELSGLYGARNALAECRDLAGVKQILDTAVAAKRYAEAKKLGAEMTGYAQEIINRATRRMGELLTEKPREHGNRFVEHSGRGDSIKSPRAQVGYKASARSQALAKIPEDVFEEHVRKPVTRLLRKAREAEPKPAVVPETTTPEMTIRHCRCSELALEPESADLVFTDPPYGREYIGCWDELGAFAAKALKPGGLAVAYSGQMFLPEAMDAMARHLDYWWAYAVVHDGAFFQLRNRRTQVGWKPLLVYRKPGADASLLPWVKDIVTAGGREKGSHDWQQSEAEAAYWIGELTVPGGHVADPFLGGGTTAAVCKRLGRRFTGCDIDARHVATASERVA